MQFSSSFAWSPLSWLRNHRLRDHRIFLRTHRSRGCHLCFPANHRLRLPIHHGGRMRSGSTTLPTIAGRCCSLATDARARLFTCAGGTFILARDFGGQDIYFCKTWIDNAEPKRSKTWTTRFAVATSNPCETSPLPSLMKWRERCKTLRTGS